MAKVNSSEKPLQNYSRKTLDELRSYKFLLGDFGIAMLTAIFRGASDSDSIMMLSGVPAACISGRMPILLNLGLVDSKKQGHYEITEKGKICLQCITDEI